MGMTMKLVDLLTEKSGIEFWTIHNMSGHPKKFKKIDGFWESPREVESWQKSHEIPEPKIKLSAGMKAKLEKAREKYGRHYDDAALLRWIQDDEDDEKYEREKAAKKATNAPSAEEIFYAVQDSTSNMPDGDPIDSLGPWMDQHGVTMDEVDAAVDAMTKTRRNILSRNTSKPYGFYDYIADVWDDFAADHLHDAKQGAYGEIYDDEWFARGNPWRSK